MASFFILNLNEPLFIMKNYFCKISEIMFYLLLSVALFFYSCEKKIIEISYDSEITSERIVFDFEGKANEIIALKSDASIEIVSCPDWVTFTKTGNTDEIGRAHV